MTRTLWIPVPLPNLNDVIKAANSAIRLRDGRIIRGVKWNELKKYWSRLIITHAKDQKFGAITSPAHFEIEFRELTRRRDPDGLIAGGLKVLLDALQDAELLENDGWEQVLSISPTWRVDKQAPGVMLTVREENAGNAVSAAPRPRTRTTAKRLESYGKC